MLYAGTQIKEDLTAELIVFNRKDKAKNYLNICLIITEITSSKNNIEYLTVMFLITFKGLKNDGYRYHDITLHGHV